MVLRGREAGGGTGIILHDPLFGLWVAADKGAHCAMPYDLFAAGWGTAAEDSNPNWTLAYNGDVVEAGSAPAPKPKPQPKPTPTPTPPTPSEPGKTMDDTNRRIRALAAYRWAEPPNFDDPAGVQVWLDHLGDFGLNYDEYVVQGGDYPAWRLSITASSIAGRLSKRTIQNNSVWVASSGLGQSGAQNDPALPHDTADFSAALESMDNPEQRRITMPWSVKVPKGLLRRLPVPRAGRFVLF